MVQRSHGKLTALKLKSLKKEALVSGKKITTADGGLLYFTVSAKGHCAWIMRYRYNGKQREYTISDIDGNSANFALTDARKRRDELRSRILAGEDIAHTKRYSGFDSSNSFAALANAWFESEIANRVKHPKIVRRVLDKHVLPDLGSIKPDDLEPSHIDEILKKVVAKGAPTVANDVLSHIKRILKYGRKRRIVQHNIAADFELIDAGGPERSRDRVLSRDELILLFKSIKETDSFGEGNELALKLLLLTCVRKMELLSAKWDEFDFIGNCWKLPPERTKSNRGILIPLPEVAVQWLQRLKTLSGTSDYVFPARRTSRTNRYQHISPDTLNVAIGRLNHGISDNFTVHDMRRTARTHLAEMGVTHDVAERLLNHQLQGVAGVYNKADYFEQRAEALDDWADQLVEIESKAMKLQQKEIR